MAFLIQPVVCRQSAAFQRRDYIPEDIQQSLMLEIGKFAGVHKHTVFSTGFVLQMLLFGVIDLAHRLAATRTLDIPDGIVGFAYFRIATVEKVSHPVPFQLFSFTVVKP